MSRPYGNWNNYQPPIIKLKSSAKKELSEEEKYHQKIEGNLKNSLLKKKSCFFNNFFKDQLRDKIIQRDNKLKMDS